MDPLEGEGTEPPERQEMKCPACGAMQELAPTCRRCKCDLSMVIEAAAEYAMLRRRCLAAFAANRPEEALPYARACYTLDPNPAATRRLAACLILTGSAEARWLTPSF